VTVALSPQAVKRLAFIRFLYTQGLEEARRPLPLAATALLSFHDAVEMFLLLAAEHLGVTLPKHVTFEGYFDEIAKATGMQLPARNAMRRMNNSRVNFKHHGSIPSATDLEQFRADVTTFFTDATQMVFAADFTGLDMTDLVTQPDALNRLRQAETHAGQGDYTEALALLSEAFDGLLNDYAGRKLRANGRSAYTWWAPSGSTAGQLHGRDHHPKLVDRMNYIYTALEGMQRAMRVVAMGLDYRRYARFEMLVPGVPYFMDGHREVRPFPGLQVGDDEYQFCKQFVIETALHLAAGTDFDLDLREVYVDYHKRQRAAASGPGTSAP
jgi:hypothetical protein